MKPTGTTLAFLRAVNVGGTKLVPMAALRDLLARAGFQDVRSLLQSGNLVFRSPHLSGRALEDDLEKRVAKGLGIETIFFVRTAKEWDGAIAANPFPKEAKSDPSHLVLFPLKDPPTADRVKAQKAAIKGKEAIEVHGREAYAYFPDGIAGSRLTLALMERLLATQGTGRNWNTALKMAAAAATA